MRPESLERVLRLSQILREASDLLLEIVGIEAGAVVDTVEEVQEDYVSPDFLRTEITRPPIQIVYLTSKCNLECVYCYEKGKHGNTPDLTEEEIDKLIVDHVIACDKQGTQAIFILFGGEPLLRKDLVFYFLKKAREWKEKGYNLFVGMNTNGTIELTEEEWNLLHSYRDIFRIEVSYDGKNQDYLRPAKDGSPTSHKVMDFMDKLEDLKWKWQMSYTLTDEQFDTWKEDFKTFYLDEWTCYDYLDRIVLRYPWNHIRDTQRLKEAQKEMREWGLEHKVSICELTCDQCRKCDKSATSYAYFVPGQGLITQPKQTYGRFRHF